MDEGFDFIFRVGNNPERAKYKGKRCKVIKRGAKNTLLVEFEEAAAPSLWDAQQLQAELSRLLGGRRVDIAPPEIMRNPYRRKTIERDAQVLYEAA